jgi:hypothetical protein
MIMKKITGKGVQTRRSENESLVYSPHIISVDLSSDIQYAILQLFVPRKFEILMSLESNDIC